MPTCGGLTAPRLVEKLKIKSQKDVKQLAEAKEIAYKEGFYSGVMLASDIMACIRRHVYAKTSSTFKVINKDGKPYV
ncbi:hypothetical protein M405DRAFT_855378 [Rhizopogon salebrosus TDB-379]|nr:hypothetical protein M405DRAFT_855378 [Rhizopogon salebrosus TDB-379]